MAHSKLTKNQILTIERDDHNARNTIKLSLTQAQELLNLKQSEIANIDMFDTNIKNYENLLSNLRNITHDIFTSPINKEQIYRLAYVDNDIIKRMTEFNVKLMALAQDLFTIIKSDRELNIIKDKMNELHDTFLERQKLFLSDLKIN